jgi:hypothetical protein
LPAASGLRSRAGPRHEDALADPNARYLERVRTASWDQEGTTRFVGRSRTRGNPPAGWRTLFEDPQSGSGLIIGRFVVSSPCCPSICRANRSKPVGVVSERGQPTESAAQRAAAHTEPLTGSPGSVSGVVCAGSSPAEGAFVLLRARETLARARLTLSSRLAGQAIDRSVDQSGSTQPLELRARNPLVATMKVEQAGLLHRRIPVVDCDRELLATLTPLRAAAATRSGGEVSQPVKRGVVTTADAGHVDSPLAVNVNTTLPAPACWPAVRLIAVAPGAVTALGSRSAKPPTGNRGAAPNNPRVRTRRALAMEERCHCPYQSSPTTTPVSMV